MSLKWKNYVWLLLVWKEMQVTSLNFGIGSSTTHLEILQVH